MTMRYVPDTEDTWTLTEVRRNFYVLIAAASQKPQTVTRRGVPSYVFRPATSTELRRSKVEYGVTVRAIRRKPKRKH